MDSRFTERHLSATISAGTEASEEGEGVSVLVTQYMLMLPFISFESENAIRVSILWRKNRRGERERLCPYVMSAAIN